MWDSRRVGGWGLLVLPAGLLAFFAFNSGGFYPGPTAYAAVVLSVVLALRVSLADEPFAGAGPGLALATGALSLYALLTLLSQTWSHAPGAALVEFDRVLVYLLALILFGSIAHSRHRLEWMLRALALSVIVISGSALTTRLLPHVWPITPELANDRLSFPLTYWNALGLISALGVVLSLHFTSDARAPRSIRVLGAAALPVLATTIYFTFSRGGIAAALLGSLVYALIARPKALLSGLLAAAPATAVAVKFAYGANLLATPNPTTPAAISQGRHVAIAVLVCAAIAAMLRWLLAVGLDPRLDRIRLAEPRQRQLRRFGWGAFAAAVVLAAVVFNGAIAHQFHRFVNQTGNGNASDLRTRLTDPGNSGRVDMWRVAWHQFEQAPTLGHGAGTFANTWAQYHVNDQVFADAHSLYLETLDELGIVGFALLAVTILAILIRTARRARGPDRALYAAVFAMMLIWALHAAVDWDWEMPAVTVPFFAIGGFMLARPQPAPGQPLAATSRGISPYARTLLGIGCLLLAIAPAYIWLSQRRLNEASAAFARGNCVTATRAAMSSISILGDRPEPYEILGYCDIRNEIPELAIATIHKAISLDPNNWTFRYDLAVMEASAGVDPMPAMRRAAALNPGQPLIEQALRTFRGDDRSQLEHDGKSIADSLASL